MKCSSCGKPTWTGCGAHIEQALRNVPADQRCKCGARSAPESSMGELLKRIFGRAPSDR